jgi:hypothetical protein
VERMEKSWRFGDGGDFGGGGIGTDGGVRVAGDVPGACGGLGGRSGRETDEISSSDEL